MTRVLGVDLGARRIGLALSDPSGTLASPLQVLERSGDDDRDLEAIVAVARDEGARRIVVGFPRSLSGASGPAAVDAERQIAALRMLAGDDLTIEAHDERFTTVIASQRLREGGGRRDATPIDAAAAAEILQSYLDAPRASGGRRAR